MAAILTVSIRSRRRSGNAFSEMLFCPISIVVLTFHGIPVSGDVDGHASSTKTSYAYVRIIYSKNVSNNNYFVFLKLLKEELYNRCAMTVVR